LSLPRVHLHGFIPSSFYTFALIFPFSVFRIQAFRLESQHLAPTIFGLKNTLTMPPRRGSQRLALSGEETAPLPSAQALPHIDEGQEIDAFIKIEEADQQHTTNLTSTSAGTVTSSGQNDEGGLPQSMQQVPSSE
jgi:hypothetical protein